jgi:hypothetical protein
VNSNDTGKSNLLQMVEAFNRQAHFVCPTTAARKPLVEVVKEDRYAQQLANNNRRPHLFRRVCRVDRGS